MSNNENINPTDDRLDLHNYWIGDGDLIKLKEFIEDKINKGHTKFQVEFEYDFYDQGLNHAYLQTKK